MFCRLEHIIPWAIKGPRWEAETVAEPRGSDLALDACAQCGKPLSEVHLLLVHHRGAHRIPDRFCSLDHAREWATAGGRWR